MTGNDHQFEENLDRALESALDRPSAVSEQHLVSDVLAEVGRARGRGRAQLCWTRLCDEERLLSKGLVDRDESAWEVFCQEYSGPLLSAVRLRSDCSQDLAAEIVRRTFIQSVKSIATFDPSRGSLFNWLKMLARRQARTVLPKPLAQGRGEPDPPAHQRIKPRSQAELLEGRLCPEEAGALILDTMMELSSHYRRVLVMKHIEHRQIADMAAMLGWPKMALAALLTRSQLAFKEHLNNRIAAASQRGRRRSQPVHALSAWCLVRSAERGMRSTRVSSRKADNSGQRFPLRRL
jgi:DNA-directed RNA polymerase specialized sigma24 family protein